VPKGHTTVTSRHSDRAKGSVSNTPQELNYDSRCVSDEKMQLHVKSKGVRWLESLKAQL